MSKKTDYKRLWKQERQKNIDLNNRVQRLFAALDPGFAYLRTIISKDQYVELMKRLDIEVTFTEPENKQSATMEQDEQKQRATE